MSFAEIAIAYLFAYPFTIFPFQGLGIVDGLLLVAFVDAGGADVEAAAVAALIVWRVFTLAGPVLMGLAALTAWRRNLATQPPEGLTSVVVDARPKYCRRLRPDTGLRPFRVVSSPPDLARLDDDLRRIRMVDHPARARFEPVPSAKRAVQVSVVTELPPIADAAALAVPVVEGRTAPGRSRCRRRTAGVLGFTGAAGQTLTLAGDDGRALVALGVGRDTGVDATLVRDLAADFARAVPQHLSLAVELPEGLALSPPLFAQVVVEGVLLARWRYFVGAGATSRP